MKLAKTIAKIMVALAAVAGAVYVVATYGDKIVAWTKKVLASLPCCCGCDGTCECHKEEAEAVVEEAVEEAVEDAAVEEASEEAASVEEVDGEAVAEEVDFEN